jgi:hypothetical protein
VQERFTEGKVYCSRGDKVKTNGAIKPTQIKNDEEDEQAIKSKLA